MKKVLIIDAGQVMPGAAKGELTTMIANWTAEELKNLGYEVQITKTSVKFDPVAEVEKWLWADIVSFHTPIWWMGFPFGTKTYIDMVLGTGTGKIWATDGRHSASPKLGYGTGGLMQGKKYMLTTTLNAPEEAFTVPKEFFKERSIDDGIMYNFHKIFEFIGFNNNIPSHHFYDVYKNFDLEANRAKYKKHLQKYFK